MEEDVKTALCLPASTLTWTPKHFKQSSGPHTWCDAIQAESYKARLWSQCEHSPHGWATLVQSRKWPAAPSPHIQILQISGLWRGTKKLSWERCAFRKNRPQEVSPERCTEHAAPRRCNSKVTLDQWQSLGEPKHVENRLECAAVPALAACAGTGMYGWMLRTAHHIVRTF